MELTGGRRVKETEMKNRKKMIPERGGGGSRPECNFRYLIRKMGQLKKN